MKSLVGKRAYKKTGFLMGIVGVIEENPYNMSPYIIRFEDGGGVGFVNKEDVILYGGSDTNDYS